MIYFAGKRSFESLKFFIWLITITSLMFLHVFTTYNKFSTCCQNSLRIPLGLFKRQTNHSILDQHRKILRRNVDLNKSNIILWYNSPEYFIKKASISLSRCKYNNCKISTNSSDIDIAEVVVFRHNCLPEVPPKRREGQLWVLFSAESPFYTRIWYKKTEWQKQFNWSITYGKSSDFSMPYASIIKDVIRVRRNYTEVFHRKTKYVAWIVSHCWSISGRDEYVTELRKYIPVDIFGKCGNMTCTRDGSKCLEYISENYKFYLSFENSLCKDYVTEKLFMVYNQKYNIIPVCRGAPNIDEYAPRKTYINAYEYETPEDLAHHLLRLGNDEHVYTSYLIEKDKYRLYFASYYRAMCSLCEKLNTYAYESVLNTDTWFSIREHCLVPQNGSRVDISDKAPDYWYWD